MSIEPLETVTDVMDRDPGESPIAEIEELQGLVALGRDQPSELWHSGLRNDFLVTAITCFWFHAWQLTDSEQSSWIRIAIYLSMPDAPEELLPSRSLAVERGRTPGYERWTGLWGRRHCSIKLSRLNFYTGLHRWALQPALRLISTSW